MATGPQDIDEIRRKMAQIRRDLHEDVQGVVEGAEAATDWRGYIRSYPWASVAVALAAGYLIVPRRHHASPPVQIVQADGGPVARVVAPEPAREKKGKGLLGMAFGMVAPVALRAAQGYALQYFEQWMAQKMAQQFQDNPALAAAFGQPVEPSPDQGQPGRSPGGPRF